MNHFPQHKWVRVRRGRPCPICGKFDKPCSWIPNEVAICINVRSDRPVDGCMPGWLHFLRPYDAARPQPHPAGAQHKPVREAPRAPVNHLDFIYNKLLRACGLSLSVTRRVGLQARGLSDAAIDAAPYVDTPTPAQGDEIAAMLVSDDLRGVAGFFPQGDCSRMVRCRSGFFVPARNEHGQIQALMYRLDAPCGKRKYLWLSSNPELTDDAGRQLYPFGTSSGAPLHHAGHHLLAETEEVVVTEGALKADVIAYLTQQPVVGIAGVSNFGRDFAAHLKSSAPNLRRILVAYDRDLIEKQEVRHAFKGLCELLLAARFHVEVLMWPAPWKGYDDFLLAQLNGQEVRAA